MDIDQPIHAETKSYINLDVRRFADAASIISAAVVTCKEAGA